MPRIYHNREPEAELQDIISLVPFPKKGEPIPLNGAIYVHSGILKFVVTSAVEAELGALFLNAKEGKTLQIIFE